MSTVTDEARSIRTEIAQTIGLFASAALVVLIGIALGFAF